MKALILAQLVKEVWPKVETGEVRPTIYKVMPNDEVNKAHSLLRDGNSIGKVVLLMEN